MASESHPTATHVFGPVASRRLGRSLGVDIILSKVCTLDCIYCQVGQTTEKTCRRQPFAPIETIITEVREKLSAGPRPDYITLAGSGEPTLHSGLGALINGIHEICDVPVVVLTNGTLLHEPAVREACGRADLILPSLDAGDEKMFQKINRPAAGLTLARVVEGMAAFRGAFSGQIWLEVFLVAWLNDSAAHVRKIAALACRIRPDKIQLNTAVRPTAEADVAAARETRLHELCALFTPRAEVIAAFHHSPETVEFAMIAEDILAMIRRRPVTVEDIIAGTAAARDEVTKHIGGLLGQGLIVKEPRGGCDFFRAK